MRTRKLTTRTRNLTKLGPLFEIVVAMVVMMMVVGAVLLQPNGTVVGFENRRSSGNSSFFLHTNFAVFPMCSRRVSAPEHRRPHPKPHIPRPTYIL